MTDSACLIFNPVAGQGNSEQDLATIRSLLESKITLDIRFTSKEISASQLTCEAIERGVEAVIASGGDGTLSEVADALVGTGIPLGIIARGTANAFAKALGIPNTIEAACQTILNGQAKIIDTAYCNGKSMMLLAGIGFEAETVEQTDRETKNRFGAIAYILSGLNQLKNIKSFEAEIETEDQIIKIEAAAITVANAAPVTSILAQGPEKVVVDDGLLDLTIVAPANITRAIAAAYHLLLTALTRNSTKRNDIVYLRARRVKVTTNPPQKVTLDGEIIGNTPIEVECIPKALTVLIPVTEEF